MLYVLLSSSIDIDMDIGMIVASLAPTILIVVTYYINKKRDAERHDFNASSLDKIDSAVNGQLSAARRRIDELEAALKEKEN